MSTEKIQANIQALLPLGQDCAIAQPGVQAGELVIDRGSFCLISYSSGIAVENWHSHAGLTRRFRSMQASISEEDA
jgi:hypothetical protein